MSDHGKEASNIKRIRDIVKILRSNKNGKKAFCNITYKADRGQGFIPRAQNIGSTNIARANGANIAIAKQLSKDKAKRNRANKIGDQNKISHAIIIRGNNPICKALNIMA